MPLRRYRRRRRRASQAYATNRSVLAPRHMYLKLRGNLEVFDETLKGASYEPTNNPASTFGVCLQLPQLLSFANNTLPSLRWDTPSAQTVTGWDAYGQLFTQYVVHGVKVKGVVSMPNPFDTSTVGMTKPQWLKGCQFAYTFTAFDASVAASSGSNPRPSNYSEIVDSPYGKFMHLNAGETRTFKSYCNMNKLFGEVVKRHDKYVHPWKQTAPTAGTDITQGSFIMSCANMASSGWHYYVPSVTLQMTFYISALSVNTRSEDQVAMAQLRNLSNPGGGDIGEGPNVGRGIQLAQEGVGLPSTREAQAARQRLL